MVNQPLAPNSHYNADSLDMISYFDENTRQRVISKLKTLESVLNKALSHAGARTCEEQEIAKTTLSVGRIITRIAGYGYNNQWSLTTDCVDWLNSVYKFYR